MPAIKATPVTTQSVIAALRSATKRVAEHDPAPVLGGQHQPPSEAAFEIECQREACEEAREHR